MELEQIVMVVLILIIVYTLLQMSQQQQQPQSDRVVYLQSPYIGQGFGQHLWRGPRPGGGHGWRHGGRRHGGRRHGRRHRF